jgi:hypothetical protein
MRRNVGSTLPIYSNCLSRMKGGSGISSAELILGSFDVRSPARGLALRCMLPGDLMGCRPRGIIDRRQPVGRCDAEHDRFGMVEDLTEGDGAFAPQPLDLLVAHPDRRNCFTFHLGGRYPEPGGWGQSLWPEVCAPTGHAFPAGGGRRTELFALSQSDGPGAYGQLVKQYESLDASPPWSRVWWMLWPRKSSPRGKNRALAT